jgi:hypothetical protein
MENYQCWYAQGEVFGSKRRMKETVVGSTSSANNVHEAANDNTNPYKKSRHHLLFINIKTTTY